MSDPRQTPDPAVATLADPAQIILPVVDLCRTASGPRDRQLLYGETITILHRTAGWSYVQAAKDGYCGYIPANSHAAFGTATHFVSAAATHAYARADFKSPDLTSLSFASRLSVTATIGAFAQTSLGFIPRAHLAPLPQAAQDPAAIAALFLGTPYLWGGNSRWGIDCSGLVQAALLACGIPCPGDSDMQLDLGQKAEGPYKRNDLLFWKGHVALVTDPETLIHANAHAMAVTHEPVKAAISRIETQGDGPVTAHRRF
ncbi:NlpC/P60 family protein [Sulfitobacter sp. F26204]|uniref:C40 family peptidase n=1 Tax=Sulfitobacter sp. F26204 TaxID=2996014 RepID=UPI00225E6B8A|nr:NlpC/P60 family protein [Sulfitobacter sp. F26204]MCX7558051.1 NlpC/P60 family protein [Sulfitobacter sp. F26204]